MSWRIDFASDAERDFTLIHDHLVESFTSFGDGPTEARHRATERISEIFEDSLRITTAPHRGTKHDDPMPGMRQLALGKATFWFTVDDEAQLIRVLAVFFGAQDQQRRMLIRLMERRHGS